MIRRVLVVVLLVVLVPARAADAAEARTVPPTEPVTTENPFLPENENVTDCISALPQPDCTANRDSPIQVVVFAVVVAGMAFIGWRIARGVRQRERELSAGR